MSGADSRAAAVLRPATAGAAAVITALRRARSVPRTALPRALDGADRLAGLVLSRREGAVTITSARLTSGLDVTLRLAGRPHDLADVSGLRLRTRAQEEVPVDSLVAPQPDGSVVLSARLPAEEFVGGATCRLHVVGRTGPHPVVVERRSALHHRLSYAAFRRRGWPGRLQRTAAGGLRVRATAPPTRTIEHSVEGVNGRFVVRWDGAHGGGTGSAVRLACEPLERAVVVPGDLDAQTGWTTATVDVSDLGTERADWEVQVGEEGDWRPLTRLLGEYPRLRALVELPEVHTFHGRTPVRVAARYSPGNRLVIRVHGERPS